MFICSVWLCTFFDRYKLLSTAMYYFRQTYTDFDGYILLWLLYTTLNFTWLWFCKNPGHTYNFPHLWIKARFEFNITLLALIQFCFFCSSIVSSINFNSPFWKCCFVKNTKMLKILSFLHLTLQTICKGNK